ncbi:MULTISPECIES: hypothetical protein [Chitinophaga]|jgi:hypothetical protein|uniref:Uncharacterized protein n=2 Tax=Chitinophaga TaxID=79328 RepID=A0A1G8DEI9_CHIFI|nr:MULTISPECIES: hypothetical protein [Chitinophaga]MCF6405875.1 hypothetical protein [Chitinophaga filiformis]PSL27660.1 hypothetical protein CLV42_109196 [Chitinophaga ginsengisoli]SDH56066.1 hypothetical protein SAMN04488121_11489 [Chitinophaga filiformis]
MIQVTYTYKNREFLQLEDNFMNQLAQLGVRQMHALLEPLSDSLVNETGKIRINLDQHPKIELEGFSNPVKDQIEMVLRGE